MELSLLLLFRCAASHFKHTRAHVSMCAHALYTQGEEMGNSGAACRLQQWAPPLHTSFRVCLHVQLEAERKMSITFYISKSFFGNNFKQNKT